MAEQKKYISLENLTLYDQLIKQKIDGADAKSLKVVEIDGNTLKFYTNVPPLSDPKPTPAYSIELPIEDITAFKTAVNTLVGTDTGKSVRTIANEELAAQLLSGKADADFKTLQALATWLEDHPEEVAEINKNINQMKALIGTAIPEGATSTNIIDYIQELVNAEKTRATAAEKGLSDRVTDLESKIGSENAFATAEDIQKLFA